METAEIEECPCCKNSDESCIFCFWAGWAVRAVKLHYLKNNVDFGNSQGLDFKAYGPLGFCKIF